MLVQPSRGKARHGDAPRRRIYQMQILDESLEDR